MMMLLSKFGNWFLRNSRSVLVLFITNISLWVFALSLSPALSQSVTGNKGVQIKECQPTVEASFFSQPPTIIWGMSFSFEKKVLAAFPVGSCEKHLTQWMDKMGFWKKNTTSMETNSINTRYQIDRERWRRETGNLLKWRGHSVSAAIGRSVFSVAWNADKDGIITEIYADAEHFHFDLP